MFLFNPKEVPTSETVLFLLFPQYYSLFFQGHETNNDQPCPEANETGSKVCSLSNWFVVCSCSQEADSHEWYYWQQRHVKLTYLVIFAHLWEEFFILCAYLDPWYKLYTHTHTHTHCQRPAPVARECTLFPHRRGTWRRQMYIWRQPLCPFFQGAGLLKLYWHKWLII